MLSRRRFVTLLGASGVALAAPGWARAAAPATDLGERLDAAMRDYVDREKFAGAVLVARGGKPLLRTAYGVANRITGEPNTPETAYQIASLTKGFTALACIQLQEAGALSLDDPITAYLPEVTHAERDGVAVTIRHVLSHTAGVPDFLGFYDIYNPFDYPRTFDQLLGDIVRRDLEFTPGTRFHYSNSGYLYAGLIIERVSGQSYEDYLKERILLPAGMTSTYLQAPPDPAPPVAKGYGEIGGLVIATSDFGRVDLAWAAGGLTSTLDDLLRWHEALLTEKLAPSAAIATMYEPVRDDYGLGWELHTFAGHDSVGHEGHTIGYDAMLDRFLADDVVIVLLNNLQFAPVKEISEKLAGIVFGS